jgi:hypothetical protein
LNRGELALEIPAAPFLQVLSQNVFNRIQTGGMEGSTTLAAPILKVFQILVLIGPGRTRSDGIVNAGDIPNPQLASL